MSRFLNSAALVSAATDPFLTPARPKAASITLSGFLTPRLPRLRKPADGFLDTLVGSPLAEGRQLGRIDQAGDMLGVVGFGSGLGNEKQPAERHGENADQLGIGRGPVHAVQCMRRIRARPAARAGFNRRSWDRDAWSIL
jgi:hypothetical protein